MDTDPSVAVVTEVVVEPVVTRVPVTLRRLLELVLAAPVSVL